MKPKQINNHRGQHGFTLIEVLVVIAAIGMMASIILVPINEARIKGRDTKRIADKNQVVEALNFYHINYGDWPDTSGQWTCLAPSGDGNCFLNSVPPINGTLASEINEYLPIFPKNNANPNTGGYNRILYNNNVTVVGTSETKTGAFLVWMQEGLFDSTTCTFEPMGYVDAYNYCYEYLGP